MTHARALRTSLAATTPGVLCLASLLMPIAAAQDTAVAPAPNPDPPLIAEALAAVSDEVRVFNDHLTILASPWMEGRLPGTRGMELAKEYMEFHFAKAGLVMPLPGEVENADGTISVEPNGSFRQPFNLGSTTEVRGASLELRAGAEPASFSHGTDAHFTVTGLGTGGEVVAPAVFVGYAIEDGPEDFTSFTEDVDLNGKVAVLLRFEPMNEDGKSLWNNGRSSWTRRAGFQGKLKAVADRGAVAAIIINTPGASDGRVNSLLSPGSGGRATVSIPVLHMSIDAGSQLVEAGTGGKHSLEALRDQANAEAMNYAMAGTVAISAELEKRAVTAENVIALLPGKGRLADQYVVVGAHLDHLGQGSFGSRDQEGRGRLLHPGADDNASGSAGILLIAQKMARDYREASDDADLRSVLFMGFSAEESGLNGSAYYANNPIYPIDQHVLMMNFDMIGRIKDKRLSLSGAGTGKGLSEFLDPIVEASPLTVIQPTNMSGASDHTSFMRKGMPVLFAIIQDFHDDYHTSRDTSDKINRVDAVHAANLFYEITRAAAVRPEPFPFVDARAERRRQREAERAAQEASEAEPDAAAPSPRAASRVQFGVRPKYDDDTPGVLVESVTPGSPAAAAGVLKNDRLVTWNGEEMEGARAFGALLGKASPGDEVSIGIDRVSGPVTLKVTLKARRQGN